MADPKSDHGHMSDALGYLCLGIEGTSPYSPEPPASEYG